MPVSSVIKDAETLTLTVHADFPVPVSRLWDAYLDPRQIEKFWGPPEYPATFTRHDGFQGGRSNYYMTSPQGEKYHGYWLWNEVVDRKFFEVTDGFALADGTPNDQLPTTRSVFSFDPQDNGSKLTVTSHFNSAADLEQLLEMGMDEGLAQAMTQIDQVVNDLRDFAADRAAQAQILSDTQVRISRVVRGTREQVWRAHHDPDLVRRWMLGPDGWKMTECVTSEEVGGTYRYWWEPEEGTEGEGFGFTGQVVEHRPPVYGCTTEQMIGTDYPPTVNEMTLTEVADGTLLSVVITYPDADTRDMVLGTGMVDGMEASYARLESILT